MNMPKYPLTSSEKVLATVVATVYAFTDKYPLLGFTQPAVQCLERGYIEWGFPSF